MIRQSSTDEAAQNFRQLLLRLRSGKITCEDWQVLLQQDPCKHNGEEFADVIRLFCDKASVAEYNLNCLRTLPSPLAHINAVHSNSVAAAAKPDDAGGLYPIIYLAVGARVMLNANLWQEVGLCNGAAGTVKHILYQESPSLPIAVLVQFDSYAGPAFNSNYPRCVPIAPLTFEWGVASQKLSRQQLPLQLRYAITIHKVKLCRKLL